MTLRHILCPFDFSEVSTHALEQAGVLARASGARLTVLHVFLSVMPTTRLNALEAATAQVIEPEDLQELRDRVTAVCRSGSFTKSRGSAACSMMRFIKSELSMKAA